MPWSSLTFSSKGVSTVPLLPQDDVHQPSRQRIHTHRCMIATVVAAFCMILLICLCNLTLDPSACLAASYILVLLLLQHWMMEWPQCDVRPLGMGAVAVAIIIVPTGLVSFRMRQAFMLVLDVIVIIVSYIIFVRGPTYEPTEGSMAGQVVLITGCNTGIGLITAKRLLQVGATVIFACRTESKARDSMAQVLKETKNQGVTAEQLLFLQLDLSSLASVHKFAQEFLQLGKDLHVLVLNAGAFCPKREISIDNLDMCLASNHFGHFLLIQLLLPKILEVEAKGGSPRIVQVNSALALEHKVFDFGQAVAVRSEGEREAFLQQPGYDIFYAYGQSKIGNMMCLRVLSRRLEKCGSKVPVNALHPGEIDTDISRNLPCGLGLLAKVFKPIVRLLLKSPYQGSTGTVFACTSPSMRTSDDMTGEFLMRMKPVMGNEAWIDDEICRQFWDKSVELTGAPDIPCMQKS